MQLLPQHQFRGRALFVRRAEFSHVNSSLLAALRRFAPEIAFDDLDLDDLMPLRGLDFQKCVVAALAEYGPGSLSSRDLLRYRVLRSSAFFSRSRRLIAERSLAVPYLFTVQTQSIFNAANGRVPNLIYTDHASLAREASPWDGGLGNPSESWLRLEAEIYRDAGHIFTFGNRVRRVLVDRYGLAEGKVTCVGTGANVMPLSLADLSPARYARRNILFAGIEWERKGGPDLLAAFKLLRRRLSDATLSIVGCTPAEAFGVAGCEVLGRVPLRELAGYYRTASCLCVPSRYEPFGNVFVEAGHFALPVIATTVGEIGDIVHEGVNGFRVAPLQPDKLADALWQVLHEPKIARRMGEEGVRVTKDYNWATVAKRMLAKAPTSTVSRPV